MDSYNGVKGENEKICGIFKSNAKSGQNKGEQSRTGNKSLYSYIIYVIFLIGRCYFTKNLKNGNIHNHFQLIIINSSWNRVHRLKN